MVRIKCLTSQVLVTAAVWDGVMNSAANQSSNSGCVGHSPWEPKSSSSFERPVPKNDRQVRFTNTRAVSGLSFETNQEARSSRVVRGPEGVIVPKKVGTLGV